MNKRFFIIMFVLSIFSSVQCFSQSCYETNRSKGIDYYNNNEYDKAIMYFELAKECPDAPSPNDLDIQISKCNKAKQRIIDEAREKVEAAERRRLAELREQERQREDSIAQARRQAEIERSGYMAINNIQFANGPGDGTLFNNYGSKLYASDVRYLYSKAFITSFAETPKTITLYIKIVGPDGVLLRGDSSPQNYTNSINVTINPHSTSIGLGGWGNKDVALYLIGTYKYELWYNGNRIYSTYVELNRKTGEASYLRVDNSSHASASFMYEGGYEVFSISTDAENPTISGVPSWCSLQQNVDGAKSFKIVCEKNITTSKRSGKIIIKAGDKEVYLDIQQAANPGPSISLESLKTDTSSSNGINIELIFKANNNKGRKLTATALFFFDDNVTPVNGVQGGQVTTSATDTSIYDSTKHTVKLFVSFHTLYKAKKSNGTLSFDIVITDENGDVLLHSRNNKFKYPLK